MHQRAELFWSLQVRDTLAELRLWILQMRAFAIRLPRIIISTRPNLLV